MNFEDSYIIDQLRWRWAKIRNWKRQGVFFSIRFINIYLFIWTLHRHYWSSYRLTLWRLPPSIHSRSNWMLTSTIIDQSVNLFSNKWPKGLVQVATIYQIALTHSIYVQHTHLQYNKLLADFFCNHSHALHFISSPTASSIIALLLLVTAGDLTAAVSENSLNVNLLTTLIWLYLSPM